MLPVFYYVADQSGRTLAEVRAMPACEFFSWLRYHRFEEAVNRTK